MDIGDVIAGVKPAVRTVPICLDGTLAEQLEQLRAEWVDRAGSGQGLAPSPDVAAVIDRIRDLEAQADAATVEFAVRSIGAKAWRKLMAEHAPPDDRLLDGWRFDPDTFPQAALAASCVEPAMTDDEADQLQVRLSSGQWEKLFRAVLECNAGDDLIPKFAPATVETPSSD